MSNTLNETLIELRQLAVGAVVRGVAYELGINEKTAVDQIAGVCNTSSMEVKRWSTGDGVPECHITTILTLLNTRCPCKWQRYSIRPGRAQAEIWERIERERRVSRAIATGRRMGVLCES